MGFVKKHNVVITSLLALVTLESVAGCSQESPQVKLVPSTAAISIAASPLASNITIQTKTQRAFTDALVKEYTDGCQSSGGTKEYCNCFIGKIKTLYSPDEFDKAGEAAKAGGKIPDAISKSMQSCQPAVVSVPNPSQDPSQNSSTNVIATENPEKSLALHLKKIGAVLYGTYWCPYCDKQKQAFGVAISEIQYIECDPRGVNPQRKLCKDFGVSSYPTWQINGQSYSGSRTLIDLANISGYQGPRNFSN